MSSSNINSTYFVKDLANKKSLLAVVTSTLMLAGCTTLPMTNNAANNMAAMPNGMQPIAQNVSGYPNVVYQNGVSGYPVANVNNQLLNQQAMMQSQNQLLNQVTTSELSSLLNATSMQMVSNEQNLINKHGNIWDVIRLGYQLQLPTSPGYFNSTTFAQKQWFLTQNRYLFNSVSRASRYLFYTVNEARLNNIPTELALLPLIDSSYDPFFVNPEQGNTGIWQLDEATVKRYGYRVSNDFDPRRDVVVSTRIAYNELINYKNQFGTWELAIAAKHSGANVVYQAIQQNAERGLSRDFWSLNLPLSTKNYVARFWAVIDIVKNPQANNVFLPAVANRPYFTAVKAENGMTLQRASNMIGVHQNELKFLNPGLVGNQIKITTPYRILVPGSNKELKGAVLSPTAMPTIKATANNGNTTQNNAQPASNTARPQQFVPGVFAGSNVASTNTNQKQNTTATTTTKVVVATSDNANKPKYQQAVDRLDIPKQGYYVVQSGNTLIGTAYKFGLTPTQLASYNNLQVTSSLYVGQKLWLKDKNGNASTKSSTSNKSVQNKAVVKNTKSNTKKSSVSTYRVKSGDTLLGVANRLGVSASALAAANGLTTQSNLYWGNLLKVPTANTNVKKNNVTSRTKSQPDLISYTVQSADSLAALAKYTGASVPEIARINKLSANSQLYVGDTIYLPNNTVNYRVLANETLSSVANKFDTSVVGLSKLNNVSRDYKLKKGQLIRVPK